MNTLGVSMFQHFIITRFNLLVPAAEQKKYGTPTLDDSWMTNRLALFEKYCFPSIKAQINQNFTWLVFFDNTTPEKFRPIIEQYSQECSAFTPVFIDGMDAYYSSIKSEVSARLTQPYLITSRVDNDDCLHEEYTQEVQNNFDEQSFMAIDFVDGYTLQIAPTVKFAKRSHVHNPFVSLIEKSENFVTVWSRKRHGSWSKVKNLKPVRNKRMWMSIIHFENATNTFLGFGDVEWHHVNKFHIDAEIIAELELQNTPFNNWKKQSNKQEFRSLWKAFSKLIGRKVTNFFR